MKVHTIKHHPFLKTHKFKHFPGAHLTRQRVFLASLLLLHIIQIKPPGLCFPSLVPTAANIAAATLNDLVSSRTWSSSSVSIRLLLPLLCSQLREVELSQREYPAPCPRPMSVPRAGATTLHPEAFQNAHLPEPVAIQLTSVVSFLQSVLLPPFLIL